jgi:hypothetical protein
MGYGSYSEAAHRAITHARSGATKKAVFARNDCDPKMSPRGVRFRECRDSAEHPDSVGIVFALDVSGSMGDIPHQLATETLPTFVTSVRTILKSPQILFMAIGNAFSDSSPFQVGQFESEAALMDRWLSAMHLEGGGGGLGESYDLALFFAARHTSMDCWEKRKKKGYLFITGDEVPWMQLDAEKVQGLVGDVLPGDLPTEDVVREAQEKFHVFYLVPDPQRAATEYCGSIWTLLLRERCIVLETPEDTAAVASICVGIEEGVLKDRAAIEAHVEEHLHATGAVRDRIVRAVMPFAEAHARGPIAGPGKLQARTDTPNTVG